MNFKVWIAKFTIANKDIYYKLSLAFGLFFVVPVAGFLYFVVKYEILNEILISETTVQAAKSNLNDAQIGIVEIKPALEKIEIYRLNREDKPGRKKLKNS